MPQSLMLLVKYLTQAGFCSRRQAAELIKNGNVKVNGHVIKEPWHSVSLHDKIQVGRALVYQAPKDYILLNKPAGYVTTLADEMGQKSVISLLRGASGYRLYPVGRLDKETKGLLLFTNDGELAHRLSHPRFEIEKVYLATLHEPLAVEHLQSLAQGIRLKDGFIRPDSIAFMGGKRRNHVKVRIHSGKNRIVRRMFEHFGYHVTKLERINYAGLIQKGLLVGAWRRLTKHEVKKLLAQAGLSQPDQKHKERK